jgi:hypothetical protein
VTQTETGTRFVVPDEALMRGVVAARAQVLLADPVDDPFERLLTARDLVRLGGEPGTWVAEIAADAVAVAKAARRQPDWDAAAALDAAAEVLGRAGEATGAADVRAMAARLPDAAGLPDEPPEGVRLLAWLERRLVAPVARGIDLLAGFLPAWAGQGVETYGAEAGGVTVGFALRWHGPRPALLWDLSAAAPVTCRSLDPAWSATEARGEALLAPYQ